MAYRLRCVACGHVVTQDRFNKDYPFEMLEVQGIGRGRGRGTFVWQRKTIGKGQWILLLALKTKLERLLAKVVATLYGYERTAQSALEMSALLSAETRNRPTLTSQLSQIGAVHWRAKPSLTISYVQRERV